MDIWCTEWATADEIRNWRRDPKLAQGDEYVGCLECGRKLFSGAEIQRHLRKIHNWSLEQYRERYPSAPTGSLERRADQAKKSRKLYQEFKRLRALETQGVLSPKEQQQPKDIGGRTIKYTDVFLEDCIAARLELQSWGKVALRVLSKKAIEEAGGVRRAGDNLRRAVDYYKLKRKPKSLQ